MINYMTNNMSSELYFKQGSMATQKKTLANKNIGSKSSLICLRKERVDIY